MTTPRVLFICGSLNQTTQLHAVARELHDVEAWFSPYYADGFADWLCRSGLAEGTIGGAKRSRWCLDYLRGHGLSIDVGGRAGGYDLVVTCTDLVMPKNIRDGKVVVVQEGIFDPDDWVAALCRRLRWLPRWLAGTALTGESFAYDVFCAASEGYRDRLIEKGVDPNKVVVTGIPNFDDCTKYYQNDFPHRGYVLVCTSDRRETYASSDREGFIRYARELAAGRQLIFKLHPNEEAERARGEIEALTPGALVFQQGSAEEMIANASALVTEWSSTVFVGIALGKEVYSYRPLDELLRLCPWQNGGTSAARIADVCRDVLGSERGSSADESGIRATAVPNTGEPQNSGEAQNSGAPAVRVKRDNVAGRYPPRFA